MKIYKKLSVLLLGFVLILSMLAGIPTKSEAAPTPSTNAVTHFNTYGESIRYFNDGTIRYAERYSTGEFAVMTRIMGYRVKLTVGGSTATVDYSGGYSTAPFNVRTKGFRTIERRQSGYEYVVYVFDFAELIENAREKSSSVATKLASGDYDVAFEFNGISEIYLDDADRNRRIFGPEYTKADTQQMFRDYNAQNHLSKNDSWGSHYDIPINILDANYGIRFTVSKSELPTVDYINKGISFPNGGGYNSSGSTYYVNLNKKVKVNTQYRGNNVDLVTQPLMVGDLQGSANAVDDLIATWNHGSKSFSLNTSGNLTWHGGDSSGKGRPNADTTSSANYVFEFDKEGGTWYVQSEARNEVNVYEGGDVSDYRHLYTLYPDGTAPTVSGIPSSTWRNSNATFTLTVNDSGSGIDSIRYYRGSTLLQSAYPSTRDTSYTLNAQTATSSGTYRVEMTDNVGNTRTTEFDVNIDKTDPSLTVTPSTTGWTSGNVSIPYSASDSGGSGYDYIRLPNNTTTTSSSGTFTATSSGTYSFTAYDNAGNTTTKSVTVNIDKSDPNGTLSASPTTWTNGNVVLTLSSISDTGSGYDYVRLPNGNTSSSSSPSQTVTSNGTYTFSIYDNVGNRTDKSITVTNIDKIDPTATVSQNAPSNGTVTLNLRNISDTGGSGLNHVLLPNGALQKTFTDKTYSVNANGTYTFYVTDNAGNTRELSITVSSLDTIPPTANLTQSPTGWTNGNVVLTLSSISDTGGSGLKSVKLPNNVTETTFTNKTYTVSSNGTYSFVIEDNGGNKTTKTITVSNIDKSSPTATLTQSPTGWTSGHVTLTLSAISDTGGSGMKSVKLPNGQTETTFTNKSYTVSANGTYTFTLEDHAGNVSTRTVNVSNIDKTDPTANLTQNPTGWTNGNVTLTLSSIADAGGSGFKSVKLPDGTIQTTSSNKAYTVSSNGTYAFEIEDNAGNKTVKSLTVSNIDKTAPTFNNPVQTPSGWTNGNVTVSISGASDAGGSGLKQIELPNGTVVTGTSASQTVTANGSYSFKVRDNAGNETVKTIVVNNIDKSSPNGTVSQTPTTWTNGNVTLNLTSVSDAGGSGLKHIKRPDGTIVTGTSTSQSVSTNGTYTFEIHDNAGNVTVRSITITNIDKTAPTANLSQTPTTWTNGNVTLNLTGAADSGGSGLKNITLPNGTSVTGTTASYVVTTNGNYAFQVTDGAGNVTTKTIAVSNIDKAMPTASISQTPTGWTNGVVKVTLSNVQDADSGVSTIELPNGTVVPATSSVAVDVTSNGMYTFKVRDNAGNILIRSLTVSNIDKVNPTASFSPNGMAWKNTAQAVTVSVSDSGGSNLSSWRYRLSSNNGTSYGAWGSNLTNASQVINLSTQGVHRIQVEVTDNAGNKQVVTSNAYELDFTNPTGSISSSTTAPTNNNVTLTFTGSDANSGVKSVKKPDGTVVNGSSTTHVVSANGSYSFEVTDNAGNKSTISFTVSNIDKVAPNGTLTQTPTGWTNGNVTLNLTAVSDTGGSGLKNIKLPNGTIVTGTSASQVVTANGTYSFVIADLAGNEKTLSITVGNIDKVKPTGSVTLIPGTTQLTIRFNGGDGLSGVERIVLPNGTSVTGAVANYGVTTSGSYKATVYDRAGNYQDVTALIESPSVTISKEVTGWTNVTGYNLIASGTPRYGSTLRLQSPFTGGAWVTTNSLSARIVQNGDYTFNVNDGGIMNTVSITIDNFDRKKPIINMQEKTTTPTSTTVNVKVNDVGDQK